MVPKLIRKSVVTCPFAFLWEKINNLWLAVRLPANAISSTLSSVDSRGQVHIHILRTLYISKSHFCMPFHGQPCSKVSLSCCFSSCHKYWPKPIFPHTAGIQLPHQATWDLAHPQIPVLPLWYTVWFKVKANRTKEWVSREGDPNEVVTGVKYQLCTTVTRKGTVPVPVRGQPYVKLPRGNTETHPYKPGDTKV